MAWHPQAESFGVPIDIDLSAIEDQLGGPSIRKGWILLNPGVSKNCCVPERNDLCHIYICISIFCSPTSSWRFFCWASIQRFRNSERKSDLNRTDMNRIMHDFRVLIVAHRGIPLIRLPPWLLRALSPWRKFF